MTETKLSIGAAAMIARMHPKPGSEQERWLASLGSKFVDVSLWVPSPGGDGMVFTTERHVDDLTTLPETIALSLDRLKGTAAIYPYMGRWALATPAKDPPKRLRYYDAREAAEMVAIHNG